MPLAAWYPLGDIKEQERKLLLPHPAAVETERPFSDSFQERLEPRSEYHRDIR